jgi:hypothetical protein
MKRIELSQRVVIEESETTRPSRLREFLVNLCYSFFLSIVVVCALGLAVGKFTL